MGRLGGGRAQVGVGAEREALGGPAGRAGHLRGAIEVIEPRRLTTWARPFFKRKNTIPKCDPARCTDATAIAPRQICASQRPALCKQAHGQQQRRSSNGGGGRAGGAGRRSAVYAHMTILACFFFARKLFTAPSRYTSRAFLCASTRPTPPRVRHHSPALRTVDSMLPTASETDTVARAQLRRPRSFVRSQEKPRAREKCAARSRS